MKKSTFNVKTSYKKTATLQSTKRNDIQYLRAFAVLSVVFYHLQPNLVRAGFIGVDIFFVISGYLITNHIIRDFQNNNFSVFKFWAKRARRLFPAAFVVLLITSIASYLFLPKPFWPEVVSQSIGSTLYFENWILATQSTDYLAADNDPTAFQQFWSLSVEEQFYLVWPVLILILFYLFKKYSVNKSKVQNWEFWVITVIGLITIVSFLYSSYLYVDKDPSAYFSTFTRVWEFGVGALASFINISKLASRNFRLIYSLKLVAVIVLVLIVFFMPPVRGYPGTIAAIPVLATVAILLLNTSGNNSKISKYLHVLLFFGTISYSLYLWHWPVIYFYSFFYPGVNNFLEALFLLAISIVLSSLSYFLIESPAILKTRLVNARPRRIAIFWFLACLITIGPSLLAGSILQNDKQSDKYALSQVINNSCFGPKSLTSAKCSRIKWKQLVPNPALASQDVPSEADSCLSQNASLKECTLGIIGSNKRIAIIGDSHAAHWVPALEIIAKKEGLQIDLFLKSGCSFLLSERSDNYGDCYAWSSEVINRINQSPNFEQLIIASFSRNVNADLDVGIFTKEELIHRYKNTWKSLKTPIKNITVIRDTPIMSSEPQRCLSLNSGNTDSCSTPLSDSLAQKDIEFDAALQAGVNTIDLNNLFCNQISCFPAIGGIVVYSDSHHITKTYSQSISGELRKSLNFLRK